MRGETHEAFRERCAQDGISMAGRLSELINFYLNIQDAAGPCPGPHCTRPNCTCVCHGGK